MNFLKNPPFATYKYDTYNLDVAVALIPIIVWAVFMFGAQAIINISVGAAVCVLAELFVNFCLRGRLGGDLFSAALTGALIALALSDDAPIWVIAVGAVSAIALAKYPLIILGRKVSFISPASLGILISATFAGESSPFLDLFRGGAMPSDGLLSIFIGSTEGAIGAVSVMLLIASGVYLLLRRAISPMPIVSSLVIFCALCLAFYPEWTTYTDNLIYQLLCGGFLFYLIFIACDRDAMPFTGRGKIIYGALFASLAFVLRCYTDLPVPEAISVLAVSLLAPVLDIVTKPVPFGGKRKK